MLLAVPLPAKALAHHLLQATGTIYGCVNRRAARAINDQTNPKQSDPAWVDDVRKSGHCFQVGPDERWEAISVGGGLVLLRKVPPRPGEPPLFFRPQDVSAARAEPAPISGEAHAPDDQRKVAVSRFREDQASAPGRTQRSSGSRTGSGGSTGTVVVMIVLLAGGLVISARVTAKLAKRRRLAAAWSLLFAEITTQADRLRVRRSQLLVPDFYGTVDPKKWNQEVARFCTTRLRPLLLGTEYEDRWPAFEADAVTEIERVATTPFSGQARAAFMSDPAVFDPRMDPIDYERHCASLLRNVGWDAQTTVASGDQGTDIIARRGGRTLVAQCKLYSSSVGNSAVQEISAARAHYGAHDAAVISNAAYTRAARQLAHTNRVFLLHHEQLAGFNPG